MYHAYSIFTYCLITIDEILISNLNVNQLAELFILSWLPPTSEETFLYEIAVVKLNHRECADNGNNTLLDGHELDGKTTNTTFEVTGLEMESCYKFGVRIYLEECSESGNWVVTIHKKETSMLYDVSMLFILFHYSLHSYGY